MRESTEAPVVPTVGMAATYGIGSDYYAMVVTAVTPKSVTAVWATVVPSEGTYVLVPEDREPVKFTLRKSGSYRPVGANCGYLRLGRARTYLDPSF